MVWATITGAGTTTATKFHGDVMNKLSNMLEGVNVTDTVNINTAVTWSFEGTSFRIRDSDDSHDYIFAGSNLAADRTLTYPLLIGNDVPVFETHIQTLVGKTLTSPTLVTPALGTVASGIWNGTAIASAYMDAASATAQGASELATIAEVNTGTDTVRTITPAGLAGSALQTKVDAISGINTGDELASSLTVSGVVELATIAETNTGTDATRAITPDGLQGSALQTKVDGIETSADVTDTANVNSALATSVGAIGTGTWQGDVVASAYLDSDTAHLTTVQTLSGAKTFSALASFNSNVDLVGSNLDNIQNLIHDQTVLTYNATLAFDFVVDQEQTLTLTGDLTTLTTATTGRTAGVSKTVFIIADSVDRVLTFNTNWRTNPSDATVTVTANTFGVLVFGSKGTAETDVYVGYTEFV